MSTEAERLPERALTNDQKRAIVERLYAAWITTPHQRLGQMIDNAIVGTYNPNPSIFYIEDNELIKRVENFAYKT